MVMLCTHARNIINLCVCIFMVILCTHIIHTHYNYDFLGRTTQQTPFHEVANTNNAVIHSYLVVDQHTFYHT